MRLRGLWGVELLTSMKVLNRTLNHTDNTPSRTNPTPLLERI